MEEDMVALRTRPRATAACASRIPDDRLVVTTALLALSTLVRILCAGIVRAAPDRDRHRVAFCCRSCCSQGAAKRPPPPPWAAPSRTAAAAPALPPTWPAAAAW